MLKLGKPYHVHQDYLKRNELRLMCQANGHLMRLFTKRAPGRWGKNCEKCGMDAWVRLNPSTNEFEFGGQAINEKCDG